VERFQAVIKSSEGLHARPAAELARLVSATEHQIEIGRTEGPKHSAASMLGILSLGIRSGERVEVEVTGHDEQDVARRVAEFLCNLGE
jgi:phosphotransferase system HPr (HPr) family protein